MGIISLRCRKSVASGGRVACCRRWGAGNTLPLPYYFVFYCHYTTCLQAVQPALGPSRVLRKVFNLAFNRQECPMNCSPSRGQRKNIKFSRPAAKCCWPLFMQQGTTCVFLSASARPSYAGLFWCCNNGCSTQSFARVPVCW